MQQEGGGWKMSFLSYTVSSYEGEKNSYLKPFSRVLFTSYWLPIGPKTVLRPVAGATVPEN